jgi:UrcA family protein
VIHSLFRSAAGLAIAASATILTIAGSAAPVSATEAPTFTVATTGIDLASPAGVARVKADIRRAARLLCNDRSDRSVRAHVDRQQCIATAINTAMPRLEALAATARDARTDLADVPALTNTVRR